MHCMGCGSELAEGTRFCGACGAAVPIGLSREPHRRDNERGLPFGLSSALVVGGAGALVGGLIVAFAVLVWPIGDSGETSDGRRGTVPQSSQELEGGQPADIDGGEDRTDLVEGPCNSPLPPLGTSDISEAGFRAEDEAFGEVISVAEADDIAAVEATFFGDAHNFTHNVDIVIRDVDEGLASDLCEAVIALEEELAFDRRSDVIAKRATRTRDLLREGAQVLGYSIR